MKSLMKKALLPIMVVSWTIYYILCDYLIDIIGSPYYVGLLLRTITFIGLVSYMFLRRLFNFRVKEKKAWLIIFIVAILAFTFDCLINIGLQFSSAASGTALLKTEMLFVLVYNAIFGKTKMRLIDGLLALSMSLGAFLIVLSDFNSFSIDWWSLLFISSALINTICAFSIKRIQETYKISSYQIVFINNAVSWLLYLLVSCCSAGISFSLQHFFNAPMNIIILMFCGICQIMLMLTYYSALGKFQVWIVKSILLLIPILTLVWDILLGHLMTLTQFIGICLAVISALAIIIREKKNVIK